MTATHDLHSLGQSLWLDNITRPMLDSGTLARYIAELDVTGLTSNPTIYDKAIGGSDAYDDAVRSSVDAGASPEETFFALATADLVRAADLFRPAYLASGRIDGFVSLEVSPLIAYDSDTTLADAKRLHATAGRENLFIKIPGTREGLVAIEEAIFAGVPINVTLLFSPAQYLACAEAYTRGIERRVEAGLDPFVASVASLFISRWDAAVTDRVPADLALKLGLAVGGAAYAEYVAFYASPRWQALQAKGATPQRLLFASTGTKDPTRVQDAVHRRARGPGHGQHDARGHAPRPRGRRRRAAAAADRRRGRPSGARPLRGCRHLGGRARPRAPAEGRRVVRQELGVADDAGHREGPGRRERLTAPAAIAP